MTAKLVIFDLDGVLIDSKNIHFNALNRALEEISDEHCNYVISKEEHISEYDELPTRRKLELLTAKKGPGMEISSQSIIVLPELDQSIDWNLIKLTSCYGICTDYPNKLN